ncbi:MAG: TolC family protein [Myxococcota bacterium]
MRALPIVLVTLSMLSGLGPALAQAPISDEDLRRSQEAGGPLPISLDQALRLAIVRSYVLNQRRLDVETSGQQVRQAYGTVYPRIDGNASYTRQIDQLNPFAGSTAGAAFFGGGAAEGFLALNPLTQDDFQSFVGVQPITDLSDNPFFIENRFALGLTVTQLLYDGGAFAAIRGAQALQKQARALFRDQARQTVRDVTQAYYDVVLAEAQADVLRRSEARSEQEVADARARVEQGTQPRFSLLTAEVQLANIQTQRLRAENAAATAKDQLNILLGVPVGLQLVLSDGLDPVDTPMNPDLEQSVATAYAERPDLEAAALAVELSEVERKVEFASYLPILEAFFTAEINGQVPDERTAQGLGSTVLNPDGSFEFVEGETVSRGFFSGDFWGPNITAGLQLRWNLFNGFETAARVAQQKIAERRNRLAQNLLSARIRAEVESEVRNLQTAFDQIESQTKNVNRAETNYEDANVRVEQGVSSQVELRDASELLDDSRLNYLNAVRDYRVAEVQYRVAIGEPPLPDGELPEATQEGHGGEAD